MAQIDTDAEIYSIRLKEQASAPAAVDTGYWALLAKEGGLYHEDDNQVEAGPLGTGLTPGGRLTLTTAVPVTTADVSAAATLYYTPYIHNMIELFDGARWIPVPFVEVSLSLVGYTASKPYDIWGYLAAGTVALESTIWTDGTTRATALAYQNGRLVKNGATTRRYLGTIYINSSGAQTDDSVTKRFVWNYYNRVRKPLLVREGTDAWTYNSPTYRAANNSTANRVEYVQGVSEDFIKVFIQACIYCDTNVESGNVGIGIDSTSVNSATLMNEVSLGGSGVAGGYVIRVGTNAEYSGYPGIGYHYIQWLESARTGTTEFVGDLGTASVLSGLSAEVMA